MVEETNSETRYFTGELHDFSTWGKYLLDISNHDQLYSAHTQYGYLTVYLGIRVFIYDIDAITETEITDGEPVAVVYKSTVGEENLQNTCTIGPFEFPKRAYLGVRLYTKFGEYYSWRRHFEGYAFITEELNYFGLAKKTWTITYFLKRNYISGWTTSETYIGNMGNPNYMLKIENITYYNSNVKKTLNIPLGNDKLKVNLHNTKILLDKYIKKKV